MDPKYLLKEVLSIALLTALFFSCAQKKQPVGLSETPLIVAKEATETTGAGNAIPDEIKKSENLSNLSIVSTEDKNESKDFSISDESDVEYVPPSLKIASTEVTGTMAVSSYCSGAPAVISGATGTAYFSPATLVAAPSFTAPIAEKSPTTYKWVTTDDSGYIDEESIPYDPAASASPVSDSRAVNTELAGKLTAGEINDFKKWKMWEDYSEPALAAYSAIWEINPTERFSVLVQTESGAPMVDCAAELIAKSGETLWQTRTDNTGKAELWSKFNGGSTDLAVDKIVVYHQSKTYTIERPKTFEKSINSIKIPASCSIPDAVDICFTVDATGSMGDEIAYLQAELLDVIGKIKSGHKDIDLNLGSVFYRDHGDTYVTRNSPFSKEAEVTNRFISEQYADGGGDGPEAVDDALRASLFDMNWSKEARARILFMILDAPPHQEKANLLLLTACIREAAKKGIRIIPLVASGGGYDMDKSMEYLMRCCALGTNGTYAFLTNHSGIGGQHTEPSTDHYDVETLNKLLLRVVGEYLMVPDCNIQTFVENEAPEDTVNVTSTFEIQLPDSLQANSDTTASINDPSPHEIVVISCYPNPASDYIWVKTSGDVNELFLTDNSGKIMQRLTPVSRLFELDLSYYPSGIYYIKAFIEEKWITARIVVARLR